MGIIAKLKDVLGIGDRRRQRRADSTDVTVERETDATSERAVKGVDSGSADAATTETTAADSGAAGDQAPPEEVAETSEASTDDGEPVDAIKGVGASYAARLGEAGVLTVEDLADADAEDLAERTGIGAGRIGNWIERARVRSR